MPKLLKKLPKLSKHLGFACVYLDGKRIMLGAKADTKTAQILYDRVIAEWLSNNRELPQPEESVTTVNTVLLRFIRHAKTYYVKNGKQTNEVNQFKSVIKIVARLYGETEASQFSPTKLEACREHMIRSENWSRKHINKQVGRVVRMFKWAASKEYVDANVYENLCALAGLKKGRSEAKDYEEVRSVDTDILELTIDELDGTIVGDMVRAHRLIGCRPTDLCLMRPCDIDRSGEVWIYTPQEHKTEHQGKERIIFVGPNAQAILEPYLDRDEDNYCFDPREAPGARLNSKERYTKDSYGRAVRRACERIFKAPKEWEQLPKESRRDWLSRIDDPKHAEWVVRHRWSPNRLRHLRGTEVRKSYGIEGAQVTLGHSQADVTQVYAERDYALARRVAQETG